MEKIANTFAKCLKQDQFLMMQKTEAHHMEMRKNNWDEVYSPGKT